MLLKKFAVVGAALATLGLPTLASANLVTYNYTNEDSTVKITSSAGKLCSISPPLANKHTPPMRNGVPGQSETTPIEVKSICQQRAGICEADVYATSNCDGNGAKPMAHLKINLETLVVSMDSKPDSKYAIDIAGSTVTIKYAVKKIEPLLYNTVAALSLTKCNHPLQ